MSETLPDPDQTSRKPVHHRRLLLKGALGLGLVVLNPSGARAAKKTTKRVSKTTKNSVANEVLIGFTYLPTGGGRVHNPYIAVWLETPEGTPVRTLTVQYEQGKGVRWLPDLVRWYQMDQARLGGLLGGVDVLSTVSSATKLPGSQRLVWDGTDDSRSPVAAGDYVLFIEAAMEKGPYQIVREPITLSKTGKKKVADNGDLQAISIDIRAKK